MYAFGDGFDLYAAVGDYAAYWDTMGLATAMLLGTPGRFTGTRCLRNSGGSQSLLTKNGANDSIHHLNFAYSNTDNQNTTPTATAIGFTLFDGSTAQCTVNFREDGTLELRSGGIGGTVLASWTGAYFAQAVWHTYEIEIVVHNTAGSITVRRNGNPSNDFTATGLNTRAGTSNNFANRMSIVTGTISGTSGCYVDDILWRSDPSSVPWIGDVRCYTRMPSADAAVQFSKAPFNAGNANFTYVDEAQQDSTSSYVYNSTTGQNDLYSLAASVTPVGTVTAVTTRGLMMKGDAPGAIGSAMQLKSGATTVQSPTATLGTNFIYQYRTDLVDPNTSSAWTAANVNSAQIGPIVTDNLDISLLAPPLDPRVTFTRASVGTFFDVNGTLVTVGNGVPRFDFDPITHVAKGLLMEEPRTNVWQWSGDISQASNNPTPNDVIKQANVALAPDGTNSATNVIATTTNGQHLVYRSYSQTVSVAHCFSIYLKPAGYFQVQLAMGNTGYPANGTATFDLNAGTMTNLGSGANAGGITPAGNGWYRCWVSVIALASGTQVANFTPFSGTPAFVGDGVSGMYAWGGQAEVGSFPTSLIPTVGSSLARVADLALLSTPNLFNASAGTLGAEFTIAYRASVGAGNAPVVFEIDDGSNNNLVEIRIANPMLFEVRNFVANVTTGGMNPPNACIQDVPQKGAGTYNATTLNVCLNGGTVASVSHTGLPVFNRGNIGSGRTQSLNGTIRRIRYWNRVLSNAELQVVTT